MLHEPNVAETLTRWAAFTEISSANRRPIQGWLHLFPRRRPQLTARRRVGKRCRVWNASLIPPVPSCRRVVGTASLLSQENQEVLPPPVTALQAKNNNNNNGERILTRAPKQRGITLQMLQLAMYGGADMVRPTTNIQFHPRLAPTHVRYRPSHHLQITHHHTPRNTSCKVPLLQQRCGCALLLSSLSKCFILPVHPHSVAFICFFLRVLMPSMLFGFSRSLRFHIHICAVRFLFPTCMVKVRRVADQGFVLDDQYSTNRTWLRLSPDGQPSRRFPLRTGDLFKVGSTLFHVVDPSSLPDAALGNVAVSGTQVSSLLSHPVDVLWGRHPCFRIRTWKFFHPQ